MWIDRHAARRAALALVVLTLASAGGKARGGLLLEFADQSGRPTSTYKVTSVGSSVDVQVFLRADGADLDLLRSAGLFGAGVALRYDDPAGVAQILTAGDVRPNPAFVNLVPASTADADRAGFTCDVGFNAFLYPDPSGAIALGSFTLTGLAPGTTSLRLSDRISGFDETIAGDGTVLDARLGPAIASLEVQAVPEPGSLVLLAGGIAAVSIVSAIRCRRGRASS
ncbi:MAG: PEP-CTERM sorting domain-containing protein [Isosphaeraceae bacterium]